MPQIQYISSCAQVHPRFGDSAFMLLDGARGGLLSWDHSCHAVLDWYKKSADLHKTVLLFLSTQVQTCSVCVSFFSLSVFTASSAATLRPLSCLQASSVCCSLSVVYSNVHIHMFFMFQNFLRAPQHEPLRSTFLHHILYVFLISHLCGIHRNSSSLFYKCPNSSTCVPGE